MDYPDASWGENARYDTGARVIRSLCAMDESGAHDEAKLRSEGLYPEAWKGTDDDEEEDDPEWHAAWGTGTNVALMEQLQAQSSSSLARDAVSATARRPLRRPRPEDEPGSASSSPAPRKKNVRRSHRV